MKADVSIRQSVYINYITQIISFHDNVDIFKMSKSPLNCWNDSLRITTYPLRSYTLKHESHYPSHKQAITIESNFVEKS